ncbi:N-acyl-aromatic-L-amino acid amidohydrolase (carboxylate-forming) isoform X2 [Rhinopithecus roxellana]|uniref:N-acyl-aromatic-L-amino acid amidohydrolase (carboxylate-forming) isoform X2 n=1 Tax=Rhinopithecus bieti TaxID=61621 RepID=UPI00083C5462|nr:PREDICTED: N-acyl-aromatic-L-amino acid amidohydrolase (carboxylate-forming) isoform X2 [Rhinopithecus bieti]XP_030774216.1 N-acyl-aromatic-L-amino acid amidohydrolase (carboxylate-forming) isoform X2 [Rhinopithecus roxellana]
MCSLPVPREPLRRVAVTGGTHGNEMSGVYLAQHWLQSPAELQRLSFSTVPVLANPAATAACRRYVDHDLNRTFTSSFLNSRPTPDDPYEVTRARELNQLLGPKASGRAFDFVLDLHNTTANMGTCLIAKSSHEVFAMHLCHHLQLQYPELSCQVFLYQRPGEESYNLDSVAKNGLALELGPQPQGVLRADIFSRMRTLVATVLDFIELFNQGTAFPAFEMEAYRPVGVVDFPRTDAGNLAGTVHPQLQPWTAQPESGLEKGPCTPQSLHLTFGDQESSSSGKTTTSGRGRRAIEDARTVLPRDHSLCEHLRAELRC